MCVCISENRRNKFKKWIAIRMCEIYFQSKNRVFFHWFKKILLGQKVSNTVIAKSFTHDLLDAFMIHSFEGCLTNRYGWDTTWREYASPSISKAKLNDFEATLSGAMLWHMFCRMAWERLSSIDSGLKYSVQFTLKLKINDKQGSFKSILMERWLQRC